MTLTGIGAAVSFLALCTAGYTAVAAFIGGYLHRPAFVISARWGVIATGCLVTAMVGCLGWALWTHDFSVKYVAEYSNLESSQLFTLSGLWAGQSGSLMFWTLLLNSYASIVVWQSRNGRLKELVPWCIVVFMCFQVFFLGLINFAVESPWLRLSPAPTDGQGLMPLLQNPTMLIHPPALYSGYVAFIVPFALALAALITGRVDDEWLKVARSWTLMAWFFLGSGLLLGGSWAYHELGWGGYWAWDPVENVALLPWLTATAFLHSLLIQQRRGMLKVWNFVLVIGTFCLTLFGTFMNRSGVESSVHAFEGSGLGLPFVALIAGVLIVSFILLYRRLPQLTTEHKLQSFMSRETAVIINGLLLTGIAFAVFWGTIFPIFSEVMRGAAGQVSVGAPFYNRVVGPLFLILLLFMAVGPLLPWRGASINDVFRRLRRPAIAACIGGVSVLLLTASVLAALSIAVSIAAIASVAMEIAYAGATRKRVAKTPWVESLVHVIDGNHGRYGGYIVHAGIALVAIGVTGSTMLKLDDQKALALGESLRIGAYVVTPQSVQQGVMQGRNPVWTATVRVQSSDTMLTLRPRLIMYESQPGGAGAQPVGEPAIDSTMLRDVYVTLTGVPSAHLVRIHVIVNPLISFLWTGGLIVLLGGALSFSPSASERRVAVEHYPSRPLAGRAVA